ncbi:protein dopey-1 homolog isoform X2 [Homarus americanus]|uniref:protein dopey-1 homolog isoform X2 n=1 Tax=Homarus americanus TaxID=6706 RepID=UPI001C47BEEE|nr:protein dopey-1 homolog isoform X2 [Homarus americanus]
MMHSPSFVNAKVTGKAKFKLTSERMSGLSLEEYDLLGDSKYRAYVAAVDKTLRNFENTSEWADLISTLGKLNKVLLSHMKYPVVPRRITISKRLAQCMHPALPSGVHLKALETYDIIFKCMGTNRLSQELFIYSAGLFPLFSSAAMNVRSALLTVYETHFVPLGPRLRPGLNGFLSGILAGLEEGSDHLERTSQLLSRVAEGVGQAEFFGCLWDCVWGNSGVRLPAITHIMACYNKKLSTEDQLYILGTNIDVTVSALCQAMEDSSVMVQRAALDLTLAALPMHNTQLLRPDLVRIVTSAILVLLRRDMSLNRRLYAWLLGSEINLSLLSSEHPVVKRLNSAVSDTTTEDGGEINAYFETFSRPLLVEGIIACLRTSQGINPPDLRPYRLIVSLLDKPEIGPYILDDIFLDLLRCLYHTCQVLQIANETPAEPSSRRQSTVDKQNPPIPPQSPDGTKPLIEGNRGFHEITKTATLLFSALQPSYPWMHLTGLLSQACLLKATSGSNMEEVKSNKASSCFALVGAVGSSQMSVCELCTLLQHLLTSLPLDTQQQTQASRLPEVLSSITALLTEHLIVVTAQELSVGLSLCQAILHKLIPSVTLPPLTNLSRPESRASIGTFASLQLHALSQVSTVPRPTVVPEASARESPPSESGIVQIGIEANEEDVSLSEENRNNEYSTDTSVTGENTSIVNENLTDIEAETSFICNGPKLLSEDSRKSETEIENDIGNSEESAKDGNVSVKDDVFSMKLNTTVDLFDLDEVEDMVDKTESKLEFDASTDRREKMDSIGVHHPDLSHLEISQEASEDEYESAPQSPNHQNSSPIHSYVKNFEKFFIEFIKKKLISNNSSIIDFQNMLYRSDMLGIDSLSELKNLLKECLHCCEAKNGSKGSQATRNPSSLTSPRTTPSKLSHSNSPVHMQSKDEFIDFMSVLKLNPKSDEQLGVFKVSCSILVDLSSLPTTPGLTLTRPSASIPQWLIGLLACVVCGGQVSPEFSLASISTLLELVMLAQSELSVWQCESALEGGGEAGVVTVNITPLLLPTHTHILLYHTFVYQHMARQLWTYLEPSMSQFHVTSTELLLQLHNLTLPHGPSATLTSAPPQSAISIVERQILLALTRSLLVTDTRKKTGVVWSHEGIRAEYDSTAMQQWITLWQVSRTLSSGLSGRRPGFDRCLFLMVERLHGDSGTERSLAHAWLATALQRSDTARLMDPILVLLLHPHTRRVSVQHVNIEKLPPTQQCQGNNCVVEESQIYAISSEGGEVMYHVSKEGRQPQVKGKQISAPDKHILAFTSISKDSKRVVTHHANFTEFDLPSSHEQPQLQSSISLMVNPFMQHPWIDMEDLAKMNKPLNLSNAVRIQNGSYQKSSTSSVLQEDFGKEGSPIGFDEQEEELEEQWTSTKIVRSILEEIIDAVVTDHYKYPESDGSSDQDTTSQSVMSDGIVPELTRHPFHSHMLLYMQVVDSGQCLNGLTLIRNIIEAQPKNSLLALASTSINTLQSTSPLILLLARHRRSVFGDGFDGGSVNDMVSQFRSTMYLQVVITVCLYYLRSYYPCLPHLRLRDEHLHDNQEVQVTSAEVLILIFTHLSPLVTDSPRGFTPYITDLLSKCKVQKCVLHCLLSTVHSMTTTGTAAASDQKHFLSQEIRTFTEEVLEYNCGSSGHSGSVSRQETYLARIIDLTLALIRLEDTLATDRAESGVIRDPPSVSMKYSGFSATKYQPGQPIPAQPMFMEVLTVALKQHHLRHLHGSWLHLFTAALPHMGPSLPNNSLRVTYLVCELLECMAHYYFPGAPSPQAPPDYTLTLLQSLTTTVHYCLLDPTQSPAFGSSSFTASAVSPTSQTAGQILYNLLHVFSPVGEIMDAPVDSSGLDPPACARQTLLCHLPRIISALLSLWAATGDDQESAFMLGSRRGVRQQIVELLSPICHHQTPHLLAAVSVVWQQRGVQQRTQSQGIGIATMEVLNIRGNNTNNTTHNKQSGVGGLLWSGCPQQLALVEMMSLLRVLPLHTLVATVKQVVKQPPIVDGAKETLPLEVSVLQVFYVYVQQCPGSQLGECWVSLLTMVKEGTLALSPPAQLVLLATLNEFVQRAPPLQEKKDIKELQEVSSKLLESCSNIAGSGLEPTTWLRRNLTVRTENLEKKEGINDPSAYSVSALSVLAELLAPLLDVLYVSEEKDKVVPLLTSIMAHVVPYLRNHTRNNMAAFAACSQLLSSLSGYQYTVRAWRRDVLDLLLDTQAFMMLPSILTYWRTIVDYLCTHDKSVFKELLSRVSMSQGGSLSLFSSKESEYETRAGLLKRLAFTIFCSETDQYMRHIPDIQERLAEVTRLGQVVPSLVAEVLLCFRVLLLRLSPRGVTSLWPVIITELVQVFLMMEQELATDTEQFSSHLKRLSTLDSSWVFSSQNGLNAHNHPAWLTLYLSACKLLDLMLALPAQHLPQFQMYRWAFVGPIPVASVEEKTEGAGSILLKSCDFVPHIARIAKLMANKNGSKNNNRTLEHRPGQLMLTVASISTLVDLQPFFNTLVSPTFIPAAATMGQFITGSHLPFSTSVSSSGSGQSSATASTSFSNFAHIEAVIERDFLEPLPS